MRRSALLCSTALLWVMNALAAIPQSPAFDVVHYAINVRLAMVDENFRGHSTITLVLRTPADSLTMNQVMLTFDTLTVNGVPRAFTTDDAAETFTVRLGSTHAVGDTLRLDIWYRRVVGLPRPGGRWGYYFFTTSITGVDENIGYTMSEPSDARFWMPCYDDPSDKATAEINATVPVGYVAASNGRLVQRVRNPDTTETWCWREDHPIATYLVCVTASKFVVVTQPFVSVTGDTIPVQYYVWQADSAEAALYLPARVRSMFDAFEKRFGPYPFDKYGMALAAPFGYGGMEHQSMTTLLRSVGFNGLVVSHEFAHQWWGDLVTCATWKDIWLNEGFASYSEALWRESVAGKAGLISTMSSTLQFSQGSWFGAIYDPEGQGFPLFCASVYSKGSWVLHMLRGVVGDSVFFKGLSAYRGKFAGSVATTRDFQASMESVYGKSLAWFFDKWIFTAGWPVYAINSGMTGNSLSVTIQQRQGELLDRAFPVIYTMPLPIHVYHGSLDSTFIMWDSLQVQTARFDLSFVPDSVKLDPDGWVLMERTTFTSVPERTIPFVFSLEQNYPNPFNPRTNVGYRISDRGPVSLKIYDVLGRDLATLVDEVKNPGRYVAQFDGSSYASGVYFARLRSNGHTSVVKMILMK